MRGFLKGCGWKALGFDYKKTHVAFVLKPWPLQAQLKAQEQGENYRRASRRTEEDKQSDQSESHTPEP